MLRTRLIRRGAGEEGFSWRGEEVSRIEGFSDAVFAFAVTLLVVSLEVPNTFDELISTMRGFFAFAICFWLLLAVWFEHYKFFRRYGISDYYTMRLSVVLLFIVLFYVYPLKFLFVLVVDQLLGYDTTVGSSTSAVVEEIEPGQWPLLMVIFGAGFVAVQLVFALLYLRAYVLRDALGLDAYERSKTREEIQGFLLAMGVGLISIAIAVLGGEAAVSWAGYAYLLLVPVLKINGHLMDSRRRRNQSRS
ncbi:MAG TPA: TMEM175 family protein [Rubrobacteraceae bacterium]|nr:TMEM175 family protein [Rubrobacteraceae bacterium]